MLCLFCKIIARTQPADIVYEDDDIIVFKDINPRGSTHVLLTPKEHIATINEMADHHTPLFGKLFAIAKTLAAEWSIVEQGYRLTVNVGRGGGQIIDHVHMHMVSGWQRQHKRA